MKKLDDLYPLVPSGDIGLYAGGIAFLALGIVSFLTLSAPLPGLIITLLAFVVMSGILLTTALLSLVYRYKLRFICMYI